MGDFLTANDTWFRPIDCLTGPDGALYVADWYDKRANHVDPVDTWDRSNGRIYKIQAKGAKPSLIIDPPLGKRSSKELVALLDDPNSWLVGEARRVLMERRDASVVSRPAQDGAGKQGQAGAGIAVGARTSAAASMRTSPPSCSTTPTRTCAHGRSVSSAMAKRFRPASATGSSRWRGRRRARRCVASWPARAKRLPGPDCLADRAANCCTATRTPPTRSSRCCLWWAIEDKAISDRDATLGLLDSPAAWRAPIVSRFIVERLARRYMDEGGDADLKACARLLAAAPGQAETDLLLRGIDKALEGRRLEKAPEALEKQLLALREKRPDDLTLLRLAVRLGGADAYEQAVQRAGDAKAPDADRIALIDLLGQTAKPDCVPTLLQTLTDAKSDAVRAAVLTALQPFADPQIADEVLSLYPKWSADLKGRAQSLLCGRAASGLELLKAVDAGRIAQREVPLDQLRRLALLKDEAIDKLIAKHWGKITPATAGEKLTQIRNIGAYAVEGAGRPRRRQGDLHEELRGVPHAVRRGRQDRPRPDRRRPQEPRLAADADRRSQRRHPPGVFGLHRQHQGRPDAHRPDGRNRRRRR